MLFASLLTLALAAISIAAPAPAPVELEDRAVPGLQRVSASLSAAVDAYQANPSSFDLRVRLCTVITGLTASQRAASLRIGFNTNSVQCPTISDQLDNIQAGLGRAYQQYTRNTNAQTTAALCAITTQLTQAQRNRIAALNISINVQCPVNVAQRLDAISPGFSSVYNALVAAPNNFANQLAFCTVIDRLNFRQTAQLQALNLNTNNLQCTNVLLRNRLNNIFLGFGDAWYKWYNNKTAANLTALCGITAQLSRQQKNRLLNLGVDVTTFNCPAN